jgi:hypothetical protein
MTFQLSFSNGARFQLIDINGAICGSKMPSATKETPTSSRQDIWAEL